MERRRPTCALGLGRVAARSHRERGPSAAHRLLLCAAPTLVTTIQTRTPTLLGIPEPPKPGPRVEDDHDALRPGAILLGRYRIERELGRGGMAVVYAASHITIGATVAIKVLHGSLAARRAAADRFLTEARAIAAVQHPNVVRVSDYGELSDGRPFMVMEYLHGHDLGRALEQSSPMTWSTLRPLLLQVCAGLQAAHDVGIVHCDVKPQNIFLVDEGTPFVQVKVLDFGIAKVGDAVRGGRREVAKTEHAFVGTPDYMAPEQCNGGEIDARADVYALGVTMYRALTGRLPFTSRHWFHTVTQHMYRSPTPPSAIEPSISEEVEALILRALEKAPKDRFPSMRAVAEAASAIADAPETSTATAMLHGAASSLHGHRRGLALGASALAAVLAGLWLGFAQLGPDRVEAAPPRAEPVEAVRAAAAAAPPPAEPEEPDAPEEPETTRAPVEAIEVADGAPTAAPRTDVEALEPRTLVVPPPPPPAPKRSLRGSKPVTTRVDRPPVPQPAVVTPPAQPQPQPAPSPPASTRLRIEEVKNPFD